MADFYQNIVPTFTRFENEDLAEMEKSLTKAAARLPVGIIIPALFKDLSSPAMQNIIRELSNMRFISRVYVSLDQGTPQEYQEAQGITRPLKDRVRILWNDSPAVQSVIARINEVLPVGPRGKGQAVWTALGYALGKSEVSVVAFHDADVLTYDRGFLLRLIFPVVRLRYQFSKGFYARYSDRLHGRVVRLFYFPFVKALRKILQKMDFLEYMSDFRYPLSGEFATFASIANELRFPSDWGIEVGILSEMYRIVRPHRICQVEITPRYDHKHQDVGQDSASGLARMVGDIARTFFTQLSSSGCILNTDVLRALKHTYMANARGYVKTYEDYSKMNSLRQFDMHQELGSIEMFASVLERAFEEFQNHPFGSPLIPEWRRIEVALDGVLPELAAAFDNPNSRVTTRSGLRLEA
jgi:glucosyl-3-phosphoglycerate synthase